MPSQTDAIILTKIRDLPWGFVLLMTMIVGVGLAMLYSASQGNLHPWSSRQMLHFAMAVPVMLVVAVVDIRFWYRLAYVAYLMGILLLLMVMLFGVEGGLGAQRWLSIFGFRFQPSELMKVCLVLALARYYHLLHPDNIQRVITLLIPILLISLATLLILKQPNLGTAAIIAMLGVVVVFLAGVRWQIFVVTMLLAIALAPIVWNQMHGYQKQRVETFLDPESDPLGAGYNIIQSKIAIGSGGFWGKGFLKGSQSQLNFVPEKQTDFIFAIIAEEFGFFGGLFVILLYGLLIASGLRIALRCQNTFGKMMALGITTILFLHVFVNIGMVMGLLPVVGVPLPLLSYGGSSMVSTLIGFGFILNAYIHRDVQVYSEG